MSSNQKTFDGEKAALLTMIRKRQEEFKKLRESIDEIGTISRPNREIPLQMYEDGINLLKVASVPEADQTRNLP